MVQRLNAAQTRQILRDIGPTGFTRLRIPEPVTQDAVENFSVAVVEAGTGRAYGLFDALLRPRGMLLGLVVTDPFTGLLMGFEHQWWVVPGHNGLPLLRAFEADCRAEGCKRLICGYSAHSGPQRMEKIYKRLGYEPYLTSVSKEL